MELPKAEIPCLLPVKESFTSEVTVSDVQASAAPVSDIQANGVRPRTTKPEMVPPPRSWFKWAWFVRLAIAALFLTWGLSGCAVGGASVAQWKDASSIVSSDVQSKVLSENTTASPDLIKPLAFAVPLQSATKLVVFNFNSPDLCGQRSCTYVAYEVSDDRADQTRPVWQGRLNPNLPPGQHLFSVAKDNATNQLCLIVNQVEDNRIRQSNFCYNGRYLQAAENRLLEASYN